MGPRIRAQANPESPVCKFKTGWSKAESRGGLWILRSHVHALANTHVEHSVHSCRYMSNWWRGKASSVVCTQLSYPQLAHAWLPFSAKERHFMGQRQYLKYTKGSPIHHVAYSRLALSHLGMMTGQHVTFTQINTCPHNSPTALFSSSRVFVRIWRSGKQTTPNTVRVHGQ
jgi:hypothetical protein